MFPKVNSNSSLNDFSNELNISLFDTSHREDEHSAIDSFILKNRELNKLIIDPTGKLGVINQMILDGVISEDNGRKVIAELSAPNPNPKFLNLILLGYVSSVEAYLRKIIRDIVNLDRFAKQACSKESIEFGTTYWQEPHMLPEALIEKVSFIRSATIINECSKLLGISSQKVNTSSLKKSYHDFDNICQLRHSIVHRFGHIGVKNLMALGMHTETYKNCIEKPITLDFTSIQKVSKTTVNLVQELNNALWKSIMERIRDADPEIFTWDLRIDKKLFKKYLMVFFESSLGNIDDKLTDIYKDFRNTK